jgi:hypothetical protein
MGFFSPRQPQLDAHGSRHKNAAHFLSIVPVIA